MKKISLVAFMLSMMLSLTGLAKADDVTIAVVGPITGQYASFGEQFKVGAKKAVEDINKAGGVLGKKIKLLIEDDACDPKQAVAAANKVVSQKVAFVAGHFCSGSSIPASAVYAEEGIIQISPASTNPKFTDERAGPNVYRVCGRDDQQGSVAGTYLSSKFKDKKIAILHDKTAYGKGLADETKKVMNAKGKKETLYEAYTAGEKDYNALVSKMKKEAIDIAYLGGYHTEGAYIIRQMREKGMKTLLVGGDALVTNEFWSLTGDAGEGTLMTFSPDPRKNPAAATIVKDFQAKKIDPEGYVLYTYAAIQSWKQAVEKAGTFDAAKVIDQLNKLEFSTVIGKFKFNKKGDPNLPPYAFYKWSKGKYDQIN